MKMQCLYIIDSRRGIVTSILRRCKQIAPERISGIKLSQTSTGCTEGSTRPMVDTKAKDRALKGAQDVGSQTYKH
jgi:hypothetical protein